MRRFFNWLFDGLFSGEILGYLFLAVVGAVILFSDPSMRKSLADDVKALLADAGDDRPGGIVSTYNSDGEQVVKVVATGQVFTIDEWDERLAARQSARPRRVKPARKGAQLLTVIARGK